MALARKFGSKPSGSEEKLLLNPGYAGWGSVWLTSELKGTVGPPLAEAFAPTRKASVEEVPKVPEPEAPQSQAPPLSTFELHATGCSRPRPSSGTSTWTTPLVRP